ncbi:MAG: hypothetical protein NBV65_09975 [Burkholderiaceae bacterium]|nr:hypothetical protein [Burkholderiaceae bacterium]
MQNRIAQMQQAWKHLTLLKSIRQPIPHKAPEDGLDQVPLPRFDRLVTPLVSVMSKHPLSPSALLFAGTGIAVDSVARRCDDADAGLPDGSSLARTPPAFGVRRPPVSSSSSIDLPELPAEPDDEGVSASAPTSTSAPSSPAPSPRSGEPARSGGAFGMRKLRKKASKVAIDLSGLVQKMSPRSGRSSPEKSSPVRDPSPTKDQPLLASIPVAERNRIAVAMAQLCRANDYLAASPTRQGLLFNGKLIGLLEAYPELVRPDALKALGADLQRRMRHAIVDRVVELEDPAFSRFVQQAAAANFVQPWTHDTADASDSVTGAKKKNADVLRPTFVRDFDNSDYFFRSSDGSLEKIADTDRFIDLIGPGSSGHLPQVVSNIASQNLGNFLKNVLFLRQDAHGNSQSVLQLHDDVPVMPLALAKASYVFSRSGDGTLTLDYEWTSSAALNAGKALRVKRMTGSHGISEVRDAELAIRVRLTISADGQWRIGNPAIRAKGWHMPVSE